MPLEGFFLCGSDDDSLFNEEEHMLFSSLFSVTSLLSCNCFVFVSQGANYIDDRMTQSSSHDFFPFARSD